ncbi:MAG: folB [Caulobacteraceae bacterium]|nr:folB [Caulobacteraceae bacterium]
MNKQPFLSSLAQLAGAKVFVRDIPVQAEIGLYSHEYGRSQPLTVDVELEVVPSASEQVGDIVNYENIVAWTRDVAAAGHIKLVETFAEQVALACMRDSRVLSARVRVEKPEALAPAIAGVEVLLRRG